MKDIAIIGRGLAGATLSFELIKRGIQHSIYDVPTLSSSSKVAAGLINPIVLKRLKMVQEADKYIDLLPQYYAKLESLTNSKFYHSSRIEHIYASIGEQNLWEEKKDLEFHSRFLKNKKNNLYPSVNAPLGLGIMENAAWLDTEAYLHAHKEYCSATNTPTHERNIQPGDIEELIANGSNVILCNGHLLNNWKLLPEGIFTPTRGEVMTINTIGLPTDAILHSSIFTIPLGNNNFKVGATYHWDIFTDTTTSEGLQKLKDDLEKIYTAPYTVIEHKAGVRPNIKDRKPLLGKVKPNLYVFNGMGSRAALMTPYLSQLFSNFFLNNAELPVHYNINRFIK